jgi:hypothetical protein
MLIIDTMHPHANHTNIGNDVPLHTYGHLIKTSNRLGPACLKLIMFTKLLCGIPRKHRGFKGDRAIFNLTQEHLRGPG